MGTNMCPTSRNSDVLLFLKLTNRMTWGNDCDDTTTIF